MTRLFLYLLLFLPYGLSAQQEHESFKQDAELKNALLKLDMTPFFEEPVNFVCDTIDKTPKTAFSLNTLMRTYIVFPKNTEVKKASETNNGYIQSFGIYKGDDALMYIRFTLNPLSGKLEEVMVEKNQ
jgi:hypothetical protein